MPPQDFIRARDEGQTYVMVDGWPYLPQVSAAAKGPVRDVAVAVLAVLGIPNDNYENGSDLASTLQVEPVLGGLSNTLYKVSHLPTTNHDDNNKHHDNNHVSKPNLSQVLVRIFGADGMIDRDVETSTFAELAKLGHTPPYYGRFANGRLEGWMEGMRPLAVRELSQPAVLCAVAEKMATLHTQFHIPPSLQAYYTTPSMWQQLEEWLTQALQNTYQTAHDAQRAASLHLETIQAQEFAWLRRDVLPPDALVVYCHNDVLAANILWDDQYTDDDDNVFHGENGKIGDQSRSTRKSRLQLIDFEYGGCNYRSFDVANHWNEYASGPPFETVPHYDWLPNKKQQTLFCWTYLETTVRAKATNGNKATAVVTDEQVEEFRREVQAFLLPNHLYWGLWAVNQAATEGCFKYDYMMYGMERFKQYHLCKQEWLSVNQ